VADKLRKRIIFCSERNCEVEIAYSISNDQISPNHEVVDCSEFYDGEVTCEKKCIALLGFTEAIRSGSARKEG